MEHLQRLWYILLSLTTKMIWNVEGPLNKDDNESFLPKNIEAITWGQLSSP